MKEEYNDKEVDSGMTSREVEVFAPSTASYVHTALYGTPFLTRIGGITLVHTCRQLQMWTFERCWIKS